MELAVWHAMLGSLGVSPETICFNALTAAYAEGHRHYHTTRHVDDCLGLLNELRELAASAAEVECALWFHDAVYAPMRKDNEQRSADCAVKFLTENGAPAEHARRVESHVLATRHAELPDDEDSRLVVDIDLSILGAPRARYEEFETRVRREYRWVPAPLYRRKRVEVLRSFAERPAIYFHDAVRARFESIARENLRWAIERLGNRP